MMIELGMNLRQGLAAFIFSVEQRLSTAHNEPLPAGQFYAYVQNVNLGLGWHWTELEKQRAAGKNISHYLQRIAAIGDKMLLMGQNLQEQQLLAQQIGKIETAQLDFLSKKQQLSGSFQNQKMLLIRENWRFKIQLLQLQNTDCSLCSEQIKRLGKFKELDRQANLYGNILAKKQHLSPEQWDDLGYIRNFLLESKPDFAPIAQQKKLLNQLNSLLIQKLSPELPEYQQRAANQQTYLGNLQHTISQKGSELRQKLHSANLDRQVYRRHKALLNAWDNFSPSLQNKPLSIIKLIDFQRFWLEKIRYFRQKMEILEFHLDLEREFWQQKRTLRRFPSYLHSHNPDFARAMGVFMGGKVVNLLAISGKKGSLKRATDQAQQHNFSGSFHDILPAYQKGLGWTLTIKGVDYILLDDICKPNPALKAALDRYPHLAQNQQSAICKILNTLPPQAVDSRIDTEIKPCELAHYALLITNGKKTQNISSVTCAAVATDKNGQIPADGTDFITKTEQLIKKHFSI